METSSTKEMTETIPSVVDVPWEHDEASLNPIEDAEVLEKILKEQNASWCDSAVEKCLEETMVPEEVVEKLLCRADKTLCTCQVTDWVEKASGYNLCGDEKTLQEEEKETLDEGTRSVGASLVVDSIVEYPEENPPGSLSSVPSVAVVKLESNSSRQSQKNEAKDESVEAFSLAPWEEDTVERNEQMIVDAIPEIPPVETNMVEESHGAASAEQKDVAHDATTTPLEDIIPEEPKSSDQEETNVEENIIPEEPKSSDQEETNVEENIIPEEPKSSDQEETNVEENKIDVEMETNEVRDEETVPQQEEKTQELEDVTVPSTEAIEKPPRNTLFRFSFKFKTNEKVDSLSSETSRLDSLKSFLEKKPKDEEEKDESGFECILQHKMLEVEERSVEDSPTTCATPMSTPERTEREQVTMPSQEKKKSFRKSLLKKFQKMSFVRPVGGRSTHNLERDVIEIAV